jgi:hypothetical protein
MHVGTPGAGAGNGTLSMELPIPFVLIAPATPVWAFGTQSIWQRPGDVQRSPDGRRHRVLLVGQAGHVSELYDGPSRNLPVSQRVARVVDLVQRVASCHQSVQWQPALLKPPDEHGEVTVRPA